MFPIMGFLEGQFNLLMYTYHDTSINTQAYTYIYLHLPVETVIEEEVVSHSNAMWLHRMSLSIIVIPNVT